MSSNNNIFSELPPQTKTHNQLLFIQCLLNEGIHPSNSSDVANIIFSFSFSLLEQEHFRKTIVETNIQGKILQQAVLSAIQTFITTQHHNLGETPTSSTSSTLPLLFPSNKKSRFHPFSSTTSQTPAAILTSTSYYYGHTFQQVHFNGEYVLAISNNTVYEWKIKADTGSNEHSHTRHTERQHVKEIKQLALSPNRRDIFATGGYFYREQTYSMRAEIVIWDISTFNMVKKIQSHELSGIFSLTFDPQGQLLIAGDDIGNVGVFDATRTDWPIIRTIKIHSLTILRMVFISSFAVVSCSSDTSLGLFDVNSGKILHQFGEPTKNWNAGNFATDVAYNSLFGVITPTRDKSLILWDISKGIFKEIRQVYAKSTVRRVAVYNDLVLTAGSTSTTFIRLWLLPNLTKIKQFDVQAKCFHITMHSSGLMFATAGDEDGKIRLWCEDGVGSLYGLMKEVE
jgi:WD40 repeat protein